MSCKRFVLFTWFFFSMFISLRRPNNDSAFLQPSYLMVPSINLNATSCVFYFSFSFSSLLYWRVTLTQTVFYAFTLANAAYDKHKNKIFSVSLRTVGSCHISFSVLASQRIKAWCFLFHPMCLCSQKERKRTYTNWVFTWMKLHTHITVQNIMRKYFLFKKKYCCSNCVVWCRWWGVWAGKDPWKIESWLHIYFFSRLSGEDVFYY